MPALIPAPARSRPGDAVDAFVLRPGDAVSAPAELRPVAELFVRELAAGGGPELRVAEGEGAIRLELTDDTADFDGLPATAGVRAADGDSADERYGLDVGADGVRVWAGAAEGIARGLTTLRQLAGTSERPVLSAQRILDAPRFAWRGLSLDVARTFFDVGQVKSVIDLLAYYKLNVLHLHLTDDQGWRLHIDARPDLTRVGARGAFAGRPGGFYTQDDYREIVRYAAERYVTVVPEIDVPGHCQAVFAAYPELAPTGWDPDSPHTILDPGSDPARLNSLDPDNPATWPFLTDVLTEVAALTPGRFVHIGGDEAVIGEDAYRRFVAGMRGITASLGKRVVGWQETARAGLAPGDVAQHWISSTSIDPDALDFANLPAGMELPENFHEVLLPMLLEMFAKAEHDVTAALKDGARILLSPNAVAYLDQPYRDAGPAAQEELRARLGLQVYPGNTLESALDWDPSTHHTDIPGDEAIAGVEAAVWCETVENFDDLEFLLLPRLAGVAEKAWAPRGSYAWDDYARRLAAQAPVWQRAGRTYFAADSVNWE
ncbi:family 20 glycosylhydrolase [Yinghuangia aomiensis]|uniref:beta-N-acetylhexosaminidase n=1 Tax=Yinghuangia aomiensis TaxID=676205 RepID=A0ABP9IAR0_9ACTN